MHHYINSALVRILYTHFQFSFTLFLRYYVDGRSCSEGDFYNPRILDYLLHELNTVNYIMKKYDPGAPRWLGETSSAYGGGASGLSDRYVAGFM